MWVDWNPTPADKNMGLWAEVSVTDSGPIALRYPHVITKLDVPSLGNAYLTVTTEVWNATDQPVQGVASGMIGEIQMSQPVSLAPREHRRLRFSSDDVPALTIRNPRLWWPYRMGAQELYTLKLRAEVANVISDVEEVRFGIQQYDSELTPQGHRLFKVNGHPILIRGGGWASDMLLRPPPPNASRRRCATFARWGSTQSDSRESSRATSSTIWLTSTGSL